MSLLDLPTLNASLNFVATILLFTGYVLIKKGKRREHMRVMWAALSVSALFLISYVVFHYQVGSVPYDGTGWIRTVYFSILIPHIILAMVIVPLVFITLIRASKGEYESHKKIARWTWPLWMFVSVTGIIIYLFMMLSGSYDKIIIM